MRKALSYSLLAFGALGLGVGLLSKGLGVEPFLIAAGVVLLGVGAGLRGKSNAG